MNPNRELSQLEVLKRLHECPEAFHATRVVGRWLWAEFDAKPSEGCRALLRDLGFHWNRERVAWQHPCGAPSRRAYGHDPRDTYGAVPAEALGEGVLA